jgi:hypothetical protein
MFAQIGWTEPCGRSEIALRLDDLAVDRGWPPLERGRAPAAVKVNARHSS